MHKRRCCRHIYNNFKVLFPGLRMRRLFWNAAKACTAHNYQRELTKIRSHSEGAYNWLVNHSLETWCRHRFDPRVKYDNVSNNHVESFNSWLGDIRMRSVLGIMDTIRSKLMCRLQKSYQRGLGLENLTAAPKLRKKLNKAVKDSGKIETLFWARGTKYEVTQDGFIFVVDLGPKTCCCRAWEISGIPCHHAVACINYSRLNIEDYCHSYYSKEKYMKTYDNMIHPLHHETLWLEVPHAPLEPPILKRNLGRPKRVRRRQSDEPLAMKRSSIVTCSICNIVGHNKRGCQRAPTARAAREAAAGPSRAACPSKATTSRGRVGKFSVSNVGGHGGNSGKGPRVGRGGNNTQSSAIIFVFWDIDITKFDLPKYIVAAEELFSPIVSFC
ncbi:uncharacterized protein LOC132313647 isoform X2 [Cornus florida]|uniref:uncharacterized protein LOC132313647 isoform X2 n=1 Tax=Cornus florida TaxID=4283 RepID=UPI00289C4B2F|nr:uncharacterized protein LOC132313647 isoform X2 [Cornus florida]